MKNLIFIFILVATHLCNAQTIPDLDFPSHPYFLKDGALQSLEKAPATIDIKATGLGGSKEYLTAFKTRSDIRFSQGTIPAIYIKLEGAGDPEDKVSVSVAEIKKDRRRYMLESSKLIGKANDISTTKMTTQLKKVRDGIYQVIFDKPLPPGEYAFLPQVDLTSMFGGNKISLYCFGVD